MTDLQTATVTLTSQDIKSLRSHPVIIVPAQGPNTVIEILSTTAKFTYGGTNPFTNPHTIMASYGNVYGPAIVSNLVARSVINGTYTIYGNGPCNEYNCLSFAGVIDNQPVVINVNGSSDITGNPANDNSLTVTMTYVVHTL